MPDHTPEQPDEGTAILRAVEELTGVKLVEKSGDFIGDPELRAKYLEIMEREKQRASGTAIKSEQR